MNLSSNFCEMGEINFEKYAEGYELAKSESAIVVDGILNDILETAMDIATKSTSEADSMQINIKHEVLPELKNIIDSLSKIDVNKVIAKPTEPANLDIQMKRFLNDMMSSPREVPRNDGVGDQPVVINTTPENEHHVEEVKPTKLIEKKSRITDLVMNSKRVLNNLLDEEQKRRQEEFEVNNETVIQLIDLQPPHVTPKTAIAPELVPLPFDDSEELLERPNEEVEEVELGLGGNGDDAVEPNVGEEKCAVKNVPKKKKLWNFGSWKFFSFKRIRTRAASTDK